MQVVAVTRNTLINSPLSLDENGQIFHTFGIYMSLYRLEVSAWFSFVEYTEEST